MIFDPENFFMKLILGVSTVLDRISGANGRRQLEQLILNIFLICVILKNCKKLHFQKKVSFLFLVLKIFEVLVNISFTKQKQKKM